MENAKVVTAFILFIAGGRPSTEVKRITVEDLNPPDLNFPRLKQYGNGPIMDQRHLPSEKILRFRINTENVTLNLVRNENIPTNIMVILGLTHRRRGTRSYPENSEEPGHAFYIDESNSASMVVWNDDTRGRLVHRVRGDFQVGKHVYFMEPEYSRDTRSYLVQERAAAEEDTELDTVVRPELQQRGQSTRNLAAIALRATRGTRQVYVVESLWFVDYSIFEKWWRRSKIQDPIERRRDVERNLKFYFAHICNGVDLRYRSVTESDYEIQIKFTGIYIATTPEDSPWTEYWPVMDIYRGKKYVHSGRALTVFKKWLNKNTRSLPPFDHGILFTDHKLWRGRRVDGSRRNILGLTDTQGVCSHHRAAISKDIGEFGTTQTAAHEMGHSLGSKHDGQKNDCRNIDQYIMASISLSGRLTDENYKNPFRFSHCSKDSFRHFLILLTFKGENCLLNTDHFKQGPAQYSSAVHVKGWVNDWLTKLPGQLMNPHEQCQAIYGRESFYCGGAKNDANICRQMPCYRPDRGGCFVNNDQRAATGTSCGNRKWCIESECVHDKEASNSKDRCSHGDFKAPFRVLDGTIRAAVKDPRGLTCANIARYESWRCSNKEYKDACCESCATKVTENPGCSDKASWCDTIRKGDCYVAARTCCATCRKYWQPEPRCHYGDRVSWCRRLSSEHCGQSRYQRLCCATCVSRTTTLPPTSPPPPPTTVTPSGCYRDQASWCSTIPAPYCYSVGHVCCRTCSRFRVDQPGCPYGDRVTWCNSVPVTRCSETDIRLYCCQKCAIVSDPRPDQTTVPPSCYGGDKASWCTDIRAFDCYNESTRKTCCNSCRHKQTGPPDCPYGDRFSWCSKSQSYCRAYKTQCCKSCR